MGFKEGEEKEKSESEVDGVRFVGGRRRYTRRVS